MEIASQAVPSGVSCETRELHLSQNTSSEGYSAKQAKSLNHSVSMRNPQFSSTLPVRARNGRTLRPVFTSSCRVLVYFLLTSRQRPCCRRNGGRSCHAEPSQSQTRRAARERPPRRSAWASLSRGGAGGYSSWTPPLAKSPSFNCPRHYNHSTLKMKRGRDEATLKALTLAHADPQHAQ